MFARISRFVLPPLILVVALVAYRFGHSALTPESPQLGHAPVVIEPRLDEPRVVTDEQLAEVLDRVKPPARPLKTNNVVHALRLWGVDAYFTEASAYQSPQTHKPEAPAKQSAQGHKPEAPAKQSAQTQSAEAHFPSGRDLLAYLLDDRIYQEYAGSAEPPLFTLASDGIRARSYDDAVTHRETSSYHADDILATLAESGTPLETPMHLRGEPAPATVQDLFDATLGRYHNDRLEYEWTLISFARYGFPAKHFRNQWGDKITLDQMVDEAITPPLELGPCNGLHRLEALTVLYRADEQTPALKKSTRLKVLGHLKRTSRLLTEAQTVDGYWTRQWPKGKAAATPDAKAAGTLYDRILVTGHHLEWLALAPEEVQPPRETIVRAGQWLTRAMLEMDEADLLEAYGPYTHAARALSLWRGKEPYAAWRSLQPGKRKASASRSLSIGENGDAANRNPVAG